MATAPLRHPELVSGSIPRSAQGHRRQTQPNCQIMPIRVLAFDQVDLPLPVPVLQLLLPRNGGGHIGEHFEAHEQVDTISVGEAWSLAFAVLPEPCRQIAGDPDVKCAVRFAGKDVDARVAFELHEAERAAQWMLKQVQHDEEGVI